MPNFIEGYRSIRESARQRTNPKGLIFSGAVAALSIPIMPPVEWGLTYAIHEITKDADPNILKFIAIGLLGLANTVSVALETSALKKDNYSAGPISSSINVLTGIPLLSSLAGHTANYIQLQILNPVNAAAFISGDQRLLAESELATSLVFTGWSASMNLLVLKSSPLMETVINAGNAVKKKLNKTKI